ncbi:ADP-ribose pyrophosphatase YjhB, NUDIX family [Paenibacillus sp. UNCCL117]|uniref:NUDIX domain-containing protein n=1 Tax=unclassified Paenibacillus TaxID=185978 RepID=UPI00088995FB|nr:MULTISPECIES: NUDIX domain-containing protein [unclassified Paenibacillus]SDC54066.1 ADP-ribose pyrophosphatase YjhB, NUDIX family [Paenibacillus sp. cl123]SFW11104.1 ADP-ribose pyrophosphatase YjhB, NUDIX family [Paenibacillus sp. UNCCL117]
MLDDHTSYSSERYRTPDGAPADIVIFTITSREKQSGKKALPERRLEVLLIQRKNEPFQGQWALPGGFSSPDESLHDCARRELQEETGIAEVHLEYFGVYSEPGRDPRGWMISHAYFALVKEEALAERRAADDAADVRLFPVADLPALPLAFDHHQIIGDALQQIRRSMMTTTIAKEFLPAEFTLSELYQIIQTVVPEFEEKNFIRKVTSTQSRKGILEAVREPDGTPRMSNRYSQRAAQLYRFTDVVPSLSIYG